MSELVRFEKCVHRSHHRRQSVNALSLMLEGMAVCVAKGNADPDVKAMVLIGQGGKFIAGADIKQMGKGNTTPTEWKERWAYEKFGRRRDPRILAAASRPPCCATIELPRRPRRSANLKSPLGLFPAPAVPNAYRVSPAYKPRSI